MDAVTTIASGPQHMQALAQANRVRLARAALKRAVAAGEADAAEVVVNCPWEVESMGLAELLTAQRRWGRTRARKLLASLALQENKRIGTLTQRQRLLLATELRARRPLVHGAGIPAPIGAGAPALAA
jgi:hypothetical protein